MEFSNPGLAKLLFKPLSVCCKFTRGVEHPTSGFSVRPCCMKLDECKAEDPNPLTATIPTTFSTPKLTFSSLFFAEEITVNVSPTCQPCPLSKIGPFGDMIYWLQNTSSVVLPPFNHYFCLAQSLLLPGFPPQKTWDHSKKRTRCIYIYICFCL